MMPPLATLIFSCSLLAFAGVMFIWSLCQAASYTSPRPPGVSHLSWDCDTRDGCPDCRDVEREASL